MNTAEIVAVTESWINTKNGNMTADEFIAYVARVSNPGNQMNSESAPKLLRYLVKHKHWSPFEMVDVVMEINTTRDIGRQVLRHRSFSFQEFSQRYADPTKDMGFVMLEARLQDSKNRQNSVETDDESLQNEWEEYQTTVLDEARIAYVWAIQNGIAKEQARAVLPEGLTMSRMYMKGSLRSWIHYCQVRMDPSTQKEHREIALAAWSQITEAFPSLKDVLDI
jgi:thymidylate synthase (FAD)